MIEDRPLRGVRVIDLTRVLAGPFCTMQLADLGAEVIKVEMPGRGDDARGYAPRIPDSDDSGYYYSINRGKKSVTIDLRAAEGAALLRELAARADLVVENFMPGTMARFNASYEELSAINPRIILCSISGFGETGPMAGKPAYDIIAQALGGTMSVTGYPGAEPTRCGVSIGDLVASLYATIAILAALRERELSGRGRHLDVALLDCQVALLESALAHYSVSGKIPQPIGSRHPSITPYQHFRSQDGYFVIGVGNEPLWRRFCEAIGLPELKDDPRFARNADRTENHAELEAMLNRHFERRLRDHWLALLERAGVPCAPIANVAEVSRNSHLLGRKMVLRADHPTFAGFLVPGSPLKTAGRASAPPTRAPLLGEHTDEVLGRILGYDARRLTELRRRKVI